MTAKIEVKNASYIYSPDTPFERAALDGVSCSFEAVSYTHLDVYKRQLISALKGGAAAGRTTVCPKAGRSVMRL